MQALLTEEITGVVVDESFPVRLVNLTTAHLADASDRVGSGNQVAPIRLLPIEPAMAAGK